MSEKIGLSSQVSILIPTMDRSLFVIRALYFYMSVGFRGCICIGDSSNGIDLEQNRLTVKKLKNKLKIKYKEFPELNILPALQPLIP